MPIHSFRCRKCNRTFDEYRSFGDKTKPRCTCGSRSTEKLLGAPVIKFKGPGWATTKGFRN